MSANSERHDESHPECGGCPLTLDRRGFLRDAALAAIGALAAGALSPRLAEAMLAVRPLRASALERVYAIPTDDSISIDAANEVILVRWQNRAYAFSTRCPHRGGKLQWRDAEQRVYCPKHKARFRADGAHASGRRTRDLDRYDLRVRRGVLVVDLDSLRRADREPAAWAAAVVELTA